MKFISVDTMAPPPPAYDGLPLFSVVLSDNPCEQGDLGVLPKLTGLLE